MESRWDHIYKANGENLSLKFSHGPLALRAPHVNNKFLLYMLASPLFNSLPSFHLARLLSLSLAH